MVGSELLNGLTKQWANWCTTRGRQTLVTLSAEDMIVAEWENELPELGPYWFLICGITNTGAGHSLAHVPYRACRLPICVKEHRSNRLASYEISAGPQLVIITPSFSLSPTIVEAGYRRGLITQFLYVCMIVGAHIFSHSLEGGFLQSLNEVLLEYLFVVHSIAIEGFGRTEPGIFDRMLLKDCMNFMIIGWVSAITSFVSYVSDL